MIIDQLIHQKKIGVSDKPEDIEIIDLKLILDDKGKIVSESLGVIELHPKHIFINRAPDAATDTKRWTKEGAKGKNPTPFKGIPFEKEKTQVKTLLKAAYTLYKAPHFSKLLLDLGVNDLEDRQANAAKITWKTEGAEKDPDSAFKNTPGIKLPCVGSTSTGWVILGLTAPTDDSRVDSNASLKLTEALSVKTSDDEKSNLEIGTINLSLHVGDGLGRNSFGKIPKCSDPTKDDMSEYARVFGLDTPINLDLLRTQFSQYLQYPMRVWPVPDSSHLAFFCKNQKDHEYTKKVLATLREERYKKPDKTEDNIGSNKKTVHTFPEIGNRKVSIALICPESGRKTKTVVSEIFPSIPLYYWVRLETQLSSGKIDIKINEFNRVIVNGPKGEASPASYKTWTKVLTNLLNGSKINPYPFWKDLPRFHKSWSNANLWDSDKAPKGAKGYELLKCRTWLNLCKIINRLNTIIDLYISNKLEEMDTVKLNEILNMSEKQTTQEMANSLAKTRVGDLWEALSDSTKAKISNAIAITESSIPEREKTNFAKGLVAGSCLNYAAYKLSTKAKRKFEPGGGMHLSQLRGKNLAREFTKASTLAENYNRGKHGENKVYPLPIGSLIFFKAMEKDSLSEAFNNGLVCGFSLPKLDAEDSPKTSETSETSETV